MGGGPLFLNLPWGRVPFKWLGAWDFGESGCAAGSWGSGAAAGHRSFMKPHRGALILVFGILSIVFAFFGLACCGLVSVVSGALGIMAWTMGKSDLKQIGLGSIDPGGAGLTNAGRICGIIGTMLSLVAIIVMVAALVLTGALIGFSALKGAPAR